MIVFECSVCRTRLSAADDQVGSLVRCPSCMSTLTVTAPQQQQQTVAAGPAAPPPPGQAPPGAPPPQLGGWTPPPQQMGGRSMYRRYGFNCVHCSSRLEATEAMAATEGQCPTCGNTITIPILDRYGRLIDPVTRQIIKQDPHPVHAYAAAGERAPAIVKRPDGSRAIECPRCKAISPVVANNCRACQMPFTMEGTTVEASGANGFGVASLVLGLVGLPAFCTVLVPILAIVFGIISLFQSSPDHGTPAKGRGMAIAGIVCGGLGCIFAFLMYASM